MTSTSTFTLFYLFHCQSLLTGPLHAPPCTNGRTPQLPAHVCTCLNVCIFSFISFCLSWLTSSVNDMIMTTWMTHHQCQLYSNSNDNSVSTQLWWKQRQQDVYSQCHHDSKLTMATAGPHQDDEGDDETCSIGQATTMATTGPWWRQWQVADGQCHHDVTMTTTSAWRQWQWCDWHDMHGICHHNTTRTIMVTVGPCQHNKDIDEEMQMANATMTWQWQ